MLAGQLVADVVTTMTILLMILPICGSLSKMSLQFKENVPGKKAMADQMRRHFRKNF
jgi:hypothetical protein